MKAEPSNRLRFYVWCFGYVYYGQRLSDSQISQQEDKADKWSTITEIFKACQDFLFYFEGVADLLNGGGPAEDGINQNR